MKYDIWMEGFQFSDIEFCEASYVGNCEGNSFEDAVWNWFYNNPSNSFNEDEMTFWECKLFPTLEEACLESYSRN